MTEGAFRPSPQFSFRAGRVSDGCFQSPFLMSGGCKSAGTESIILTQLSAFLPYKPEAQAKE